MMVVSEKNNTVILISEVYWNNMVNTGSVLQRTQFLLSYINANKI